MRYERIERAVFLERPNRFIAYVELNGQKETVHVKNTGRCAELLVPGASVYVQRSANPDRKTKWDLIAVEKGSRMINMDSQIPNRVVQEWIEGGAFFENVTQIRPETTWGNSRFDLYVETGGRKIFIEVKGVTLERDGVCLFPDAPSDRAVKHLEELARAVKEGYEAYVFFVIQMRDVKYFTPNRETHPAFADALQKAAAAGVHILAYDCEVSPDSVAVRDPVDVVLGSPELKAAAPLLVDWYRAERRDLPWRKRMNAYRVWISEIMLQQTRVETVIPYFERFIRELPDVAALAAVSDDRLMKLWEGLGYYSRARNLKETACRIMEEYGGFWDVSPGHWAAGYIEDAARYGWVVGYGDGTFHADDEITRAEVVTIVNRLLGREADQEYIADHPRGLVLFPDVSKGYWAYYDILEAANSHEADVSADPEVWQK